MPFTWSPPKPPDPQPLIASIEPVEVLYDFDGPVLFVAAYGFSSLLCYKIEEVGTSSQYILSPTNPDALAQLKAGKLALRSAIVQPWMWAVEVDADYCVVHSWLLKPALVPNEILPEPNLGIYHEHGLIKERVSPVAPPFLSVHFKGGQTRAGTLPFGVFKNLLDEVYEATWSIFAPALHEAAPDVTDRTMRKAFNVPVYEPQFSSLFIAIERPSLDFTNVRNQPVVDVKRAQQNIDDANRNFLDSVEVVTAAAGKGRLTKKITNAHLEAIEAMSSLVPGENSVFDSIEIQGILSKGKSYSSSIDAATGQRIKDAFEASKHRSRTIKGRIVETSARSFSFIVRTGTFREVTCRALSHPVREALVELRNGMKVSVTGDFRKRKRRDVITIEELRFSGKVVRAG